MINSISQSIWYSV